MNDALRLFPAALAGIACGAGFLGGLWWTIQHGLRSQHAALWFFGSTMLRTGAVIAVFAWAGHGDVQRLLACSGGFLIARVTAQILGRLSRPAPSPAERLVAEPLGGGSP